MQCSWKAVIVLALASIAIQYTAIRTLTSKPFQLCPLPSPQNCGLGGQETDPPFERGGGAGCEDYNYFTVNASRKTHVLVLATTRSGSSFVGQLLNQHQDVFYLFEPLYHVQTTLIPRLSHSRNAADRRVMLGASRDLLRSLYGCDLYFLESYIKPAPANHSTDKLFRRGASRALCQQPACDAFGPEDANVEEGDCPSGDGASLHEVPVAQWGRRQSTDSGSSLQTVAPVYRQWLQSTDSGDGASLHEVPVAQWGRRQSTDSGSSLQTVAPVYRQWGRRQST
ncbi:unnamed protein product [Boreogadus saida]